MNKVGDAHMIEMESIIRLSDLSSDNNENNKRRETNNLTFINLTSQVLVVNLINIPFMLKEMEFLNGVFTIILYILCASFSLILIDNIGTISKKYNLYKAMPNAKSRGFLTVLNFLADICRLYFTSSHIIGYFKDIYFESQFYNTLFFAGIIFLLLFIDRYFRTKVKHFGFINASIALLVTGYGFYASKRAGVKESTPSTNAFNYFQQLGLLALWSCPNNQMTKILCVKNVHAHIFGAFFVKIVLYLTIAIMGYFAFKDTTPIFVNNFENQDNPIIFLFYLVSIIRVPNLVKNLSSVIARPFFEEDASSWFHAIVGFVIILPAAKLCEFSFMKTFALISCTSLTLLVPPITFFYYRPKNIVLKTLGVINLLIGVQMIVCSLVVYFLDFE
ncbi:hypothetical protein EHP00_1020 [Ecytonucleospora hepatopenaei]|uniref:Amino acid transporter transmembrane domain-containing protein n=1 Tax=Ecytonucleospora hepatopenaei TaxID=646526 RepID=A0A1W0E504_9MICR|nr:hypothetical protein EHP00_1020 [Ecytonucleospora hepatopenaei]